MQKKILIKNGNVYSPVGSCFTQKDIAIEDGMITDPPIGWEPERVIDATDCIVTPGLIDLHVHAYDVTKSGLHNIDVFCIPNGVTTCVDAGTTGIRDIADFMSQSESNVTRTFALLHPATEGQTNLPTPEDQTPSLWDTEAIKKTVETYSDRIVGLKVRQQDTIQNPYHLVNEHVEAARRLAEELNLPLVVHVNNPATDVQETARLLAPGDIYCHVYAGTRENIIDEEGKIKPEILKARERGVIFDASNGRTNFVFKVAIPAAEQGFMPDIISSDVNCTCYYEQPITTLPMLMSKYLALGMTLEQVLYAATMAPARWLKREELASLDPDTVADVSIFRIREEETVFYDWQGDTLSGDELILPQMTIRDGSIVYCRDVFMDRMA